MSREAMPQSTDLLQETLDLLYMGWIGSEWRMTENNRRAKFYRLIPQGKKQLEAELATWDRLSSAIASVLGQVAEAS
jgi:PadR family transcriptional regulator PadR